jgi:Icc-related predicted phosphoesterase
MKEACTLKVRQYLAHGIPVLAAYRDTDIDDSMPFFLRIGNFEGNVEKSLKDIKKFIEFGFQNKEMRSSAREFSEQVLSNESKEMKRLQFFEELLSK